MPCSYKWFNASKTIFYYKIEDPWNWDEFTKSAEEGWALIRSVAYRVDAILDFTDSHDRMPSGLFQFLSRLMVNAPEQVNLRAIVGLDPEARKTIELFLRMNQASPAVTRIHFFDTLAEGTAYLLGENRSSF